LRKPEYKHGLFAQLRALRRWVRTDVVGDPFGWVLPLVLSPICLFGLSLGLSLIVPAAVLVVAFVGVLIFALFEAFYGGLWTGRLPWMLGKGVIWRTALWTFSLWLLAVSLLVPLTAAAYKGGLFQVDSGVGETTRSALSLTWDFLVLYWWHLVDTVPGLEITDTLGWDEPVVYDEMELGAGLLLYRAAVLLPLIASLRGILATRRDGINRAAAG
jgi:hypothetical protein